MGPSPHILSLCIILLLTRNSCRSSLLKRFSYQNLMCLSDLLDLSPTLNQWLSKIFVEYKYWGCTLYNFLKSRVILTCLISLHSPLCTLFSVLWHCVVCSRLIAVRCEPQTGVQVAIAQSPRKDFFPGQLVKERKWENLGGSFKEVRWDKMEGKNFLNKMELLMSSLTSSQWAALQITTWPSLQTTNIGLMVTVNYIYLCSCSYRWVSVDLGCEVLTAVLRIKICSVTLCHGVSGAQCFEGMLGTAGNDMASHSRSVFTSLGYIWYESCNWNMKGISSCVTIHGLYSCP